MKEGHGCVNIIYVYAHRWQRTEEYNENNNLEEEEIDIRRNDNIREEGRK